MSSAAPNPAIRKAATQDHTKGARLLRRDPFEMALSGCARAIGGHAGLALTFAAATDEPDPLGGHVTRRPTDMDPASRAAARGEADLAGLYRSRHDPASLDHLSQLSADETLVIKALERVRIEAIGSRTLKGVAGNLAAALNEQLLKPRYVHGSESFLRSEAVAAIMREHLAPAVQPARRFQFIETRRSALTPRIAPYVALLGGALASQERFAEAALALARTLASVPEPTTVPGDDARRVEARGDSDPGPIQRDQLSDGEASGLQSESEEATSAGAATGAPAMADAPGGDVAGSPALQSDADNAPQAVRRSKPRAVKRSDYRIFTTAFDRTVPASVLLAELPPPPDAAESTVDDSQRPAAAKLAGRLRRKLMAQQPRGWTRDLAEGTLDPGRLARVVVAPNSGRFYREPKHEPYTDTVVTLLLDNSSSMRGEPLRIVAMAAEQIARAIESCGIRVEILGFTTQSWRGGRARAAWVENGQPPNPGRVSEILHIVYKRADAPLRDLRSLRLMTRKELHKENVDGEALEWACRRLLNRPERRRILFIISDGAPSEETTLSLSHDPGNCLENHLRAVIDRIERRKTVELFAIGIGYDVARLYPKAVRIDSANGVAGSLADTLPKLLDPWAASQPQARQ